MSGKYKHFANQAPADWDVQQLGHQASFLQSAGWGQFQTALGNQVHYLSGAGWSCLLIEKRTPLGRYLFAPYGPTLGADSVLKPALECLKSYGLDQSIDWLRLEPMLSGSASRQLKNGLAAFGAAPAAHNREPDLTRIIDLAPQASELLASISQSTRSLIRKNQRESFINFKTSSEPRDIQIFIDMLGHVTSRKKVFFFEPDYFKRQAEILMPPGLLRLELALQDGEPIASALFHDFGANSSYTFAASLPEARKTSASALLLWQALLNAKSRGLKRMDLFGIAPEGASDSHPWLGFTAFKSKFGGAILEYSGTWDVPLSRRYRLYSAAYRLKSARRR